ncbi:MAG: cbb3-type cytochrome c oxidase subunit I [Acidobacteriota bacterium]|nr:cbb3-type cytochrome c oxidase subunit I [Acidobacteriota bacterium]
MVQPQAQSALQPKPGFVRNYIFSADHKVIGIQYFLLGLCAVWAGVLLSLIMRIHLAWPHAAIPLLDRLSPLGAPGGLLTPEYYLSLLTLHGTLMVFFVLTTVPQSAFGNYFLPLQLGAREMAFPRLNMLSFWLTLAALVALLSTIFVAGGPAISGWTAYPPLSALGAIAGPGEGLGQTLWLVSIGIFCLGSVLGAINFIVTTLDLRTRGMKLMRMPLTAWAWFVTAVMMLFSFSVLLGAAALLLMDRLGGTRFFIPSGLVVSDQLIRGGGGSPLLWQHLFWFFGHPEVYIAILPGMGVTSHVLSIFSRKPVFGYRAMVYSTLALGFLGFCVWGHHMFVSGMNPYDALVFGTLTMVIAVPSAVKTFNWLGTIWGGKLHFSSAMLFALGFVSLFITGGISGLFLAQPPLDLYLHATYFVVAHFHLIMGVAAIFGIFAATYFWFPKATGRMMNETLGRIHFWFTFIGVYCIFMPMHFLGLEGNPRRYSSFSHVRFVAPLMHIHVFISVAALATAAAQVVFMVNLVWSLIKGDQAKDNPWRATSLEWTLSSPPPRRAFGARLPLVRYDPYEYGLPDRDQDYVMQNAARDSGGA